jgi:hypothetical protein
MRRSGLMILTLILFTLACNLTTQPPPPTANPLAPSPTTILTNTPVGASVADRPTLPPLPNISTTPVAAADEGFCLVYTTYSGNDPGNLLSLRAEPSASSTQVLRIPNFAPVLLVSGSQEVQAEGYHWLNVIYIHTDQTRYQGWMARDSFSRGGVRDPSIATLRLTGQQQPC